MNVLSLFDGMSCGRIALEKAGIKIDKYFSSEIDPYAIKIAKKNYPDTVHLGDITKIKGSDLPKIDLIIGGSPCQDLSFANEEKLGLEGKKSNLFWEYIRLLKETNPIWFLLENVRMEKKWQDVISSELHVEPIKINSRLLSAQSRNRLYWTNIPRVTQPVDLNLKFIDVLEAKVDRKYYFLPKSLEYLDRAPMNRRFCNYLDNEKSTCITANFKKSAPYNVLVQDTKENAKNANLTEMVTRNGMFFNDLARKLTPLECERLQTLPEGYTEGVSDTQRYAMIGNGWTVDVITHIFKNMDAPRLLLPKATRVNAKLMKLDAKKPTPGDVILHQALNFGKNTGIEPFWGSGVTFTRRKRIKK